MKRKLLILISLSVCLAAFISVPRSTSASAQGASECAFVAPAPTVGAVTPTVVPTARPTAVEIQSATLTPERPECAAALAYPGPFTNHPTAPVGPYAAPLFEITSADQAEVIAVDDPSPQIAHSGSESFILAYIGTGLVAFGAVALGSRRRLFIEQG